MLLVFLFVLGFLSQHSFCTEIEDNPPIIEIELHLDENVIDLPTTDLETSEIAMEDTQIEPEEEEKFEDTDDNDSVAEVVAHGGINFAGPVNAKGTVAVGATFGYDSPITPISFPPYPFTGFYPNFYPMPLYPMIPPIYSHVPLLSMFLPEGSPEFQYLESLLDNQEVYLEVTPLNLGVFLPDKNFKDEYPDLEDCPQIIPDDVTCDDEGDDDKMVAGGVVFGGLIPASGTVTVAAKF